MIVKLFMLGMPGSGKSTVSRHILELVKQTTKNWSVIRLCDYDILYDMFQADAEHIYFHPIEHEGFYVRVSDIYNTALKELESRVEHINTEENQLVIVEFARSDYFKAFKNFSRVFLEDSFFLFLDADIRTCMKRVNDRVVHPTSRDDHYVSPYTFEAYGHRADMKYLASVIPPLCQEYGIAQNRMKIIDNNGTEEDFVEHVNRFINIIVDGAVSLSL